MLDKEFQYFIDQQKELVKKYNGKFIVIIGHQVVGAFNTIAEAYDHASEKYEDGTYLIQECIPGEKAYTQNFNSRVIFA